MEVHCHRCKAPLSGGENFCPRCDACANCGLLQMELAAVGVKGFCASCGTRLQAAPPRQGLVYWLGMLLWVMAVAVSSATAFCFGVATLLIIPGLMVSVADWKGLLVCSAVFGLSVWAIIALNRRHP